MKSSNMKILIALLLFTGIYVSSFSQPVFNEDITINGELNVTPDGTNGNYFRFLSNASSQSNLIFYTQSTAQWNFYSGGDQFRFRRAGSSSFDLMTFTSDGKIGIGTTSPSEKLHISGGSVNGLIWPVVANNELNGSTITNYGVGIKLKHSHNGETNKWGGIASIQESSWANESGLALYANEAERVRIDHNGNVGIGTSSPDVKLTVNSDGSSNTLAHFVGSYSGIQGIQVERSGGDKVRLVANYTSYGGGLESTSALRFAVNGDMINNPAMIINAGGNVGVGKITPSSKLHVDGKITSEEVKVEDVSGADYVFAPDYNLMPLAEIESYIKTNQHLPDIPSAKEMEANGLELGKMNMLLLQKIEELTLHVIELGEQNKELRTEINELKNENR